LYENITGYDNTAIGSIALFDNTTGYRNTAVGSAAMRTCTGDYNTGLGYSSNSGSNYDNSTGVGYNADCTASNQVLIGNSSVTSIRGYANWTNISDARFKTNITEDIEGLAFIKSLRPVSYNLDVGKIDNFFAEHYNERDSSGLLLNSEKDQIRYSGFIAQEVEASAKQIGYDFSGVDTPKNNKDFYGLRYAEFVVPLVKGMQEQQEMIERQNLEIENLRTQNEILVEKVSEIQEIKTLFLKIQAELGKGG